MQPCWVGQAYCSNKTKPSEEMGEKTNQNPAAVTPYLRYTLTPLLFITIANLRSAFLDCWICEESSKSSEEGEREYV